MTKERNLFPKSVDSTNNLANRADQVIQFLHIPSGESVMFKAFVTNFSDDYSSNWSPAQTMGRMDPLLSYERTTRQIALTFEVIAGSEEEADQNLIDVSKLIKMLYPEYENGTKGASGMNTAPYFKVQFMNFISKDRYSKFDINNPHVSGLLVTMDGITATHGVDNGFFQGEDFSLKPKLITLSCNLVVAHEDENDPSWKEFITDEDQQVKNIQRRLIKSILEKRGFIGPNRVRGVGGLK